MASEQQPSVAFRVRAAQPADVPAPMRLKRLLAEGENSLHAVRASAADWLRDGFGPNAGFTAFVAEDEPAEIVVGMATSAGAPVTGWNRPVVFPEDLIVDPRTATRRRECACRASRCLCAWSRQSDRRTDRTRRQCRADFYQRNGFSTCPSA